MKTKTLTVAAILMCDSLLTSSCVGSFSLFNKLASWNKNATNSKFLNEIIFIVYSNFIFTFALVNNIQEAE